MTRRFQNFINGRSIPPNSNDWIDSVNPATGEVWAQIARSNVVDVRLAVESAKRASEQHDWRYNSANRSKILHDIADRLEMTTEDGSEKSKLKCQDLEIGIVILLLHWFIWKLRS